jgi:hypothetical protein
VSIENGTSTLTYYGRDIYGNTSATNTNSYSWDTTAPVAGVSAGPVGSLVTNASFSITLTNSDGTGYWSTNNGGIWNAFTLATNFLIVVDTPSLRFYSADVYGNVSSTNIYTYTWGSAPVVTIISGPTNSITTNQGFNITLESTQSNGYWSTNGSLWGVFASNTNVSIAFGTEYLLFYGNDGIGNVSATNSNAYSWDVSAPVVTITGGPSSNYLTNQSFTIALSTSEIYGYWSTNSVTWKPFNLSTNFSIAVGTPYLTYYGRDAYGNTSLMVSNEYVWDVTAPVSGIISGPAGDYTNNDVFSVTLTNSDGIGYWSTNGSTWNSYVGNTAIAIQINTPFLSYYGIDVLGNVSITNSNTYTWYTKVVVLNGNSGTYDAEFTVTLTNTMPTGYWSTNGLQWDSFSNNTNVTIEFGTEYLLYYGSNANGVSVIGSNWYTWDTMSEPGEGTARLVPEHVFVNNGDNALQIFYKIKESDTAAILIFNFDGFVIRRLDEEGAGLNAYENYIYWNGKDLYDNYVTGLYFIVMEINGKVHVGKKRKIVAVKFYEGVGK